MSNLYYKKDIHKSIEGLLYGLFVYQYLLDTSTLGLLIRCLVQDQLLSLKSKAPTLRIAIYAIIAAAFLAFLRHLHAPERYAVIIDFIGNVSTPGWSKLFWLDVLIALLQIVEALIVFNFIKADDGTGRAEETLGRRSSRRSAVSEHRSTEGGGATPSRSDVSGSVRQSQAPAARSSRDTTSAPLSSSTGVSSTQPSSPLFEYTSQHTNGDDQDDLTADYYVDHEEIRYSEDDDRRPSGSQSQSRRARRHSPETGNTSLSRTDERRRRRRGSSASSNGSNNDDEEEDPLGDDYEEILEQETFVLQVQFKDLLSYLFSDQEAVSFPRIPDPRVAASPSTSSANTYTSNVQSLPV